MNVSRRIARMTRHKNAVPKMQLTSLMDIFTTLVFFLVVNSGSAVEMLHQPKEVTLPESVVEAKPRETVVIVVGKEDVLVQGETVAHVAQIQASANVEIGAISARLAELKQSVIGVSTEAVAGSQEVTVLADREIPFSVLKKILATCTGQGYTRVSLAVVQKAPTTTQGG